MDFEIVTEGLEFPEGPVAMDDGSVVLVEIRRGTLTRVTPDGRKEVVAELGGGPNGAAIGPDGRAYVCNNGGFVWAGRNGATVPVGTPEDYVSGSIQAVDLATGAVETLYTECDGTPLRGPNDIVFDADGGMWFTDLGKTMAETLHHGAVFHAKADGSGITRQRFPLITPNGCGLSPDGKTLHVAETRTSRVWSFDLVSPGVLGPHEGFRPGRLLATLPDYQLLDSLAIQADGAVCVATLMRGGISIVDAGTGAVEFVGLPDALADPYVTNICFGGADMRDAWITCSTTGRLLKTRWAKPGLRLNFNA